MKSVITSYLLGIAHTPHSSAVYAEPRPGEPAFLKAAFMASLRATGA